MKLYKGESAILQAHQNCLKTIVWLTRIFGGVYFVFLRQEGFRQPPRKHFVINGKIMENRSMKNPWNIEWKNHGKLNGKYMGNPWIIKTEKRKCFRGSPF